MSLKELPTNGIWINRWCHKTVEIRIGLCYNDSKQAGGFNMAEVKVKCPYCGSEEVVFYGKNSTGKQRMLCKNPACAHKAFRLEYTYNASRPGTKEKIVEMVMNGSGTRDTGRVLKVSKDTVTSVLKKQRNTQSRLMKNFS